MWCRSAPASLAALIAACAAPTPAPEPRAVVPEAAPAEEGPDSAAVARLEGYFPNIELTDQSGQHVRFYDDLIRDRVVLINFMYTRCEGVCPGIIGNLVEVQRLLGERLGRDIWMLSISLDARDTPEDLRAYAQGLEARPGWRFLIGDPTEVSHLRRRLGAYDPDPAIDADRTQHSGMVVFGNEPLGRWGAAPGLLPPQTLLRSLETVLD